MLAAHLDRRRVRRERQEDFGSLVSLCHDLGVEARDKTCAHLSTAKMMLDADDEVGAVRCLGGWKSDMAVVYVCLNEVAHYEVRYPSFSTALTRLWLEVDSRNVAVKPLESGRAVVAFLNDRQDRIAREVAAMAGFMRLRDRQVALGTTFTSRSQKRRGYAYDPSGFTEIRGGIAPRRRLRLARRSVRTAPTGKRPAFGVLAKVGV